MTVAVALFPICRTRGPSAKTLRYGVELAELELTARQDIELTGLGQVLPEEVPRTFSVGRRTDEIARADHPGPGRGCRGRLARRLRCEAGHRGNRIGDRSLKRSPPPVRRWRVPDVIRYCAASIVLRRRWFGLTDARRLEVADRFYTADPRQPAAPGSAPEVRPARGLENGLVRPGRQRVNIGFERYYLRSAVDTRFVASVGWCALFRTETA